MRKSCNQAAFKYLMNDKSRLSKGREIKYCKLETQTYFLPGNNLSVDCMRQIYCIRMRNLQLKCNYPSQYNDTKCIIPSCISDDSQQHLFLSSYFDKNGRNLVNKDLKYEDIFTNNVSKQLIVKNIMMTRYNYRTEILSSY